ncbi:MAG TPA: FHA domain-containing protein, partial [Polyangiaceae bacterium]
MARLILATAEGQQAIELRPVNSLGRHPNNTIQLLDKIVSKEHCILELRDGQFLLRDLGSLNGTFVNGERVRGEQFLRHGDEISLGSTRARYDDGSGVMNMPPLAMSPGAVLQPHNLPPSMQSGPQQQQPAPPSNWQPSTQQSPQNQLPAYGPSSVPRSNYGAPPQQQSAPPQHPSGAQPVAQQAYQQQQPQQPSPLAQQGYLSQPRTAAMPMPQPPPNMNRRPP